MNIRSICMYEPKYINQEPEYSEMQQSLDRFVEKWAKFKLGLDLIIEGNTLSYNDDVPIDPEFYYGIGLLYKVCFENYNNYNVWLVYAPFYTPRTRDMWMGFYDLNKMVFNTYMVNYNPDGSPQYKDESYLISEEMLHALLHKMGKPSSIFADKVHENRNAGLADFFDINGNFIKSGTTRDYVENSKFMAVGGTY